MSFVESESYVDYTIRLNKKFLPDFQAMLTSAPEHQVIDVKTVPSVLPPVVEATWQQELSELSDLIEQTKLAYSEGNQTSINGFTQIFSEERDILRDRGKSFDSLDDFVEETIAILLKSHGAYSTAARRPIEYRPGRIVYLKSGNNLTPRDTRMLIRGRGLNGEVTPVRVLGESEGFASSPNNGNVKVAIQTAQRHLLWALTSDYFHPSRVRT